MRYFGAGLFALVTVLMVPLVVLALWTHLVVLDAGAFAEMSDDILQQPEARAALGDVIADELQAQNPVLQTRGVRPLLLQAIDQALDTPALRQAFRGAIADAHQQLADDEPAIRLSLGNVIPVVVQFLRPIFPGLDATEASLWAPASITIVEKQERPELWTGFKAMRGGSLAILIAFGAFLVGTVVVAPSRGAFLAFMGFAGALLSLSIVMFAGEVPDPFRDEPDPVLAAGFGAAWDVIAGGLQTAGLWLAGGLAVMGVVGVGWFVASRAQEE